jgi:hypothetical protein
MDHLILGQDYGFFIYKLEWNIILVTALAFPYCVFIQVMFISICKYIMIDFVVMVYYKLIE